MVAYGGGSIKRTGIYDEIMEMSDNYTSKDALKTRKYKCMEQLQKRIEEKFNMYNLKPYLHERGNFK